MKKVLLTACSVCFGLQVLSQENLWWKTPVNSPEVNKDNTVTFRLKAPKASSVEVVGDFLSKNEKAEMKKVDNEVWEYTTPKSLNPELYSYSFMMDGVKISDPSNVFMSRDVVTISNLFMIDGKESDLYKVKDVPHGSLSKVWYHSDKHNADRRITVYTPAGYETNNQRYPVLYLLHGMGGDEDSWSTLGRAAQILDNLIAQGKAQPMIVVMTNGNSDLQAAWGESPTGYVTPTIELPKTTDGSFEDAFPEVVTFVDKAYRTIAKKESRAIAGLSMGGFHSMQISKEYPTQFNYIGLFSASARFKGRKESHIYENCEEKIKKQFSQKPALYWIAIGKEDFLYEENQKFRSFLDSNGFSYTYVESEGGHIWKNWRNYLCQFLPLLFK
ncbi:MAG: alpha/beta hydrolase-fold protein [Paludibacteraceae bacterium]|nr:alpha/beta hydrolase-fold protein [Paludibacteraceae bacterium]